MGAQAAEEGTARRTIAVIDGNSLMHRAYHAIMQPMTAPDGRSTNALFGFFNMFIKMVETFHPDGIICAFDKGKPPSTRASQRCAWRSSRSTRHSARPWTRRSTSSSPW